MALLHDRGLESIMANVSLVIRLTGPSQWRGEFLDAGISEDILDDLITALAEDLTYPH